MRLGLLLVGLAAPLAAQSATWVDPGGPVIDSIFARYNRTNSPGCALGVFSDGRVLYSRGYGMADLNQGIAISPTTPFYIASTSKQFAAASVALAVEQGKLRLDDPISKFFPELPRYAERITVDHLIHHTSGLRDYLGLWGMSGRSFADEIPEDVALDLIARQLATDFEPGTRWSYSNSGYFLLSLLIRRTTGESLAAFSRRYLFEPLGMRDTHWHDDNQAIVPRRAEGYQPTATGFKIVRTSFALVGDGGLYTTVEDLAKWDGNFYHNRLGQRGAALIEQLTTPGRLTDGSNHGYGFGLMSRRYRGHDVIEHGGSFIGYRAQLMRFPGLRFSVAILCNDYTAQPERLAEQVADRYLAARLAAVESGSAPTGRAVRAEILDRYVGRFELMPGQVGTVRRKGDGLELVLGGTSTGLTATSDSTFVAPPFPGELVFRPTPAGIALVWTAGPGTPAPRLGPPPTLGPEALQRFAGRFVSEELDSWVTVAVVDSGLWIRARTDAWTTMTPIAPDVFLARGNRMAFVRDRKGQVSGFRLSAGRAANIGFVRTATPLRVSPLDRPAPSATATPR